MKKIKDMSIEELFREGDKTIANIELVKKDMKKRGIIGFCKECGCNIYKNKNHNCKS